MLIVPTLATEYTDPNNLPVFKNILRQLRGATYLSRIIFGLDQATEADALMLRDLLREYDLKNYLIQWNDGPEFGYIYKQLTDAGFAIKQPGKGRNMFMSFGVATALGAQAVGLIDADIKTFRQVQLDRLFFPVVALGYDFSKAYYSRLMDRMMYGRVKRLLMDPLLLALKRKFTETRHEKMLNLIVFLLSFNYQLSGEVAFHVDLLKRMRFATNWGVEIFTLIEVYRKASSTAQVMFSEEPFDHKHQDPSPGDQSRGLNRMAIDIVTTLMHALVIEEGLEIPETFFRDLAVTYQAVAEEQIKKYSDDAAFNNLRYDRGGEEKLVKETFHNAIVIAGDLLTAPHKLTDRLMRLVHSHEEFRPYLENGLVDTILKVEEKTRENSFEMPQTVSWERVSNRLPKIFYDLIEAVEQGKKRFS